MVDYDSLDAAAVQEVIASASFTTEQQQQHPTSGTTEPSTPTATPVAASALSLSSSVAASPPQPPPPPPSVDAFNNNNNNNNAVMMMTHSRGVSFRQTDVDRKDSNNNQQKGDTATKTTTTNGSSNNECNKNTTSPLKSNSNSSSKAKSSRSVTSSSQRSALPKQNSAYNHIDLRTGMRTTRWQSVAIIDVSSSSNNSSSSDDDDDDRPQICKKSASKKWGSSMQNLFHENNNNDDTNNDNDNNNNNKKSTSNMPHRRRQHCKYRITSHAAKGVYINNVVNSQKTHVFSNYIRWTFKSTFFVVTLASFVQFMVLIIFFAIFIYWIDFYQPACLAMGNDDYATTPPNFMDAYHLSWTTLSTVGYGVVAPGLPSTSDGENCFGISILMAFESFVGVLFCGFISAIMFSKVARVQSIAPITFSDPMLVRYGTGVLVTCNKADDATIDADAMSNDDNSTAGNKIDLPCPILEFRIVNDLWNHEGGEIINASINMVASTDIDAQKEFDNDAINCTGMYNINDNILALGKAVANVTGQAIGHVGTKTGQAIGKTGQAIGQVGSKTGQALGKTRQALGSRTSMTVKSISGGSSHHNTMNSPPSSAASLSASSTTISPPSLLRYGTGDSGASNGTFTTTSPPSFFRNGTGGSAGGTLIQKIHNTFTKSSPVDAHPGFAQAAAAAENGGSTAPYNQKQLTEDQINKEVERRLVHLASTGQLLGTVIPGGGGAVGGGISNNNVMRQSVAVEEGDSKLVPPRIYHKLDIETDTHPFFRRVWIVRHVLNETSPLVSIEARCRIKENKGYWPEEYNNYQSVREHVNFMEIIVSLSGTMNVSGSSVYGLKVYDYVDMNVGYTFATLFTTDATTGKMIVDKVLLNDVRAQAGGGEEPLQAQDDDNNELLAIAERTYAVTAQVATTAADKTTEIVQGAAEKTAELAKGAADKGTKLVQKTTDYLQRGSNNNNNSSSGSGFSDKSGDKTTTATTTAVP